ncbi:methyltransferase domain-containing protein [Arsukibacterium sp.]|uniref:methyltransferase domain-containing protein n=1 Tax=Arsukibacterium sp. TaxID=1977258 RepID=UPI002FD912A1
MTNKSDRNFDSIAAKFQRNIYQSSKGQLRQAVLMRDLNGLALLSAPCHILDVGGGQGQIALQLAERGHQLLLTDISADMLALAEQQVQARQLMAQVSLAQLSLQQLALRPERYALVLCHAVLEWLADPAEAIVQLRSLLLPGGVLSLMFYNVHAKRFSNILYGNFDYVQAGLQVKKTVSLSPQNPILPEQVEQWCSQNGLAILSKTGVRCFHDYLRDRRLQQSHYPQLLELEMAYNQQEPYLLLGRYQHWLLQADNN